MLVASCEPPLRFKPRTHRLRGWIGCFRGDNADMNPLESDNELVIYHSWFASPFLDLEADPHTYVRNG